jgi:hypothetical protein
MKHHWRVLASLLPSALERKLYNKFFQRAHALWEASGKLLPPSHLLKQQALRSMAQEHGTSILVETGTFMGDMVYAMLPYFDKIYSIELSTYYFKKAQTRFQSSPKVQIINGDSADQLKELVSSLNQPALFWLDGHYSGGNTALGLKECPVFEELKAIFSSSLHHVIIIDDARLFVGKNDYPTIEELSEFVKASWPNASIQIENDSICVTNRSGKRKN